MTVSHRFQNLKMYSTVLESLCCSTNGHYISSACITVTNLIRAPTINSCSWSCFCCLHPGRYQQLQCRRRGGRILLPLHSTPCIRCQRADTSGASASCTFCSSSGTGYSKNNCNGSTSNGRDSKPRNSGLPRLVVRHRMSLIGVAAAYAAA